MLAHVNLKQFLQLCGELALATLPHLPPLTGLHFLPLSFNSLDRTDGAQAAPLDLQLLQSRLVLKSLVVPLQVALFGEVDVTYLTPEFVRMRGQMETQLTFCLCPEVAELAGKGSPAAARRVTEQLLHTACAEVAFLAGQRHARARLGSLSLLVCSGQAVFLQSTSPSKVDLTGLAPEFSRVDADVIFKVVLPLCDKITLVAHKIDILSGPWLIPGFGDTGVDFLHV